MTLGFGTTLIGEAVDYAIYFLVQARGGAGSSERWREESWPTVRLGLFTSLIGFAALVFTGFPGLAQLGVFSIAGLAAAAATTRFVFPVIAPNGAPGAGFRRQLGRFMAAAAHAAAARCAGPSPRSPLAAVVALVVVPSPWHGELSSLSPIAPAELALDAALRADLGAADAGTLVAVSATDEQGALAAAEAVGARLDALVAAGVLQGYDSPARLLPPAGDAARAPRRVAGVGRRSPRAWPRRPPAARCRRRACSLSSPTSPRRERRQPVERKDLAGTPLAAAVDALLIARRCEPSLARPRQPAGRRQRRPSTPAAFAPPSPTCPGARVVAVKSELDAIYARFLGQAEWQALVGAGAVLALLALHLRSARRLLAVALPIAAATLLVLAALALRRRRARHPASGRPAAHRRDRLQLRALLRPPARAARGRQRHPRLAAARQPDDGGLVRAARDLAHSGAARGRRRRRAGRLAVPGLLGGAARPAAPGRMGKSPRDDSRRQLARGSRCARGDRRGALAGVREGERRLASRRRRGGGGAALALAMGARRDRRQPPRAHRRRSLAALALARQQLDGACRRPRRRAAKSRSRSTTAPIRP